MNKVFYFFFLLLMISSCNEEKEQRICDYDYAGNYRCKLETITEVPAGSIEHLMDVVLEINESNDHCSVIFMLDSNLQVEAQVNDSGIFTAFKPEWINRGDYNTSGRFFGSDSVKIFYSYYHENSVHDYYYSSKFWLGQRE